MKYWGMSYHEVTWGISYTNLLMLSLSVPDATKQEEKELTGKDLFEKFNKT